jgi:hypothetical protein
MPCGVYEIWVGPYFYQGSSQDVEARIHHHKSFLERNKHGNRKMQYAFNKHNSFEWQMIVECSDRKVAYEYEQDYIDANWGDKLCLNLSNEASSPPNLTGTKQSKEHVEKRIKPHVGSKRSVETREKMSMSAKNRDKIKCPHCEKEGVVENLMTRWHFDNCKARKD